MLTAKLRKEIDPKRLRLFANELITTIVNRTQSGIDFKGNTFKKYSKSYAEDKAKEFGSDKVNLTRTGNMLNSITWKAIPNGIRLYFSNRENMEKAYKNQLKRKFFGFNENDLKELVKKL